MNDFIKRQRTVIEAATKGLTLAQSRYKKQGDASRHQVRFEIGERVWLQLRLEQYHNTITRKFAPRYAGPYEILELIPKGNPDAVSVMLDVPKQLGWAKSYHVSKLKKFVEDDYPNRNQVLRLDPELVKDVKEYEVEAILDHRYKRWLCKKTLDYLVKWLG